MLSTLISKKKKKSVESFLNNVKVVITLSDRLKQAGIKECESKVEIKNNKNSKGNPKKRKNHGKKHTIETLQSAAKKKKKHRDVRKMLYQPHLKEPNQSEPIREGLSKNSTVSPENKNSEGSTEDTIYVSLDFIKDCQKYKKKFKYPAEDLGTENQRKNLKSISTNRKEGHDKKEKLQMQEGNQSLRNDELLAQILNEWKEKKSENSAIKTSDENLISKAGMNEEYINQFRREFPEFDLLPKLESSVERRPSDDIAKIDKKYLKSILSIATSDRIQDKVNMIKKQSKNHEREGNESKMNTEIVLLESKITIREVKNGHFNTDVDKQSDFKSVPLTSNKCEVSARIVRDLTKSELQIQLEKENEFQKQIDSEMKSEKDMAHHKPEQKKRKTRPKIGKNRNEEFGERAFSGRVSKVADVKELWRRELDRKSDNSLSSHSSCTVVENDEITGWKNLGLESYKNLEKLVEEEVYKIHRNVKKENEVDRAEINKASEFKKNEFKASGTPTKINKKLMLPLTEHDGQVLKGKGKTECPQFYSTYEGEKQKPELTRLISENEARDSKMKLKLLEGTEKKSGKIPSQIIQNWSIMNRLEQAFLALGTPNFPKKGSKEPTHIKSKHLNSNDKAKCSSGRLEKNNEIPKNKDLVTEFSPNFKVSQKIAPQTIQNKKSEVNSKRNSSREKRHESRSRKESRNDTTIFSFADSKDNEGITSHQKKQKHQNQPNRAHHFKKGEIKCSGKSKSSDSDSQFCQKKSSRVLEHSKNSEKILERKRTFDVIPINETFPAEPQKSKSCTKLDSFETESIKKIFLHKTDKKEDKNRPKSSGRNQENSLENDTNYGTKRGALKPKASQPNEKVRVTCEKECFKSYKGTPKTNCSPIKRSERLTTTEYPNILPKADVSQSNSNDRAIKERSILSMRGNQTRNRVSRKKLLQLEEKPDTGFSNTLKSTTADLLLKKVHENYSNLVQKYVNESNSNNSVISTNTYELKECNRELNNSNIELDSPYQEKNASSYQRKISEGITLSYQEKIPEKIIFSFQQEIPEKRTYLYQQESSEKITSLHLQESSEKIIVPHQQEIPEKVILLHEQEIPEKIIFPHQQEIPEKLIFPHQQETQEKIISSHQQEIPEEITSSFHQRITAKITSLHQEEIPKKIFSLYQQEIPEGTSSCHQKISAKIISLHQREIPEKINSLSQQESTEKITSLHRQNSTEKITSLHQQEISEGIISTYQQEMPEKLTSSSSFNGSVSDIEQNYALEEHTNEITTSKYQTLWEQDIHRYRALVKEIMSQYKRLNGFLKLNECSDCFSSDSANWIADELNLNSSYSSNSQNIYIEEYRKKIFSEYQAIPFFEYKTKLQQKKGENVMLEERRKRNLSVVADLKAEMDLDVKDYQPNIQKILDSQLYVDTEGLAKRNDLRIKSREKKASLQEIITVESENSTRISKKFFCAENSCRPKQSFVSLQEY